MLARQRETIIIIIVLNYTSIINDPDPARPAECLRSAKTEKIILWVAMRTARSANFFLIMESIFSYNVLVKKLQSDLFGACLKHMFLQL